MKTNLKAQKIYTQDPHPMKNFFLIIITLLFLFINNTARAGAVSGNNAICTGSSGVTITYTALGFTNPQYYNWTITAAGATAASATTVYSVNSDGFTAYTSSNTIQVFFPANISNTSGSVSITTAEGTATLPLSLWKPAGSLSYISGQSHIYVNDPSDLTGKVYSVAPNALITSYVWTLPTGATFVSQNANTITVNYSSSFTGGTISVFGVNGPCGAGSASTLSVGYSAATPPTAPTASASQNFCEGATVSNLSASVPSGCNLVWYTSSSGGTALSASTSLSTTTYYAESQNSSTGLASTSRTAVVVTVNPIPTITATTPSSLCGSGSVTLGASASSGIINWYPSSTGGSSLGIGTSFTTPSLTTSTTYYVDAMANGCTTSARTAILATVNPIPTITATTPSSLCGSGSVTLGASANSGIINWYSSATGGSSLGTGTSYTTPSLSSSTTYYVDATANSCTTPTRTAIIATINIIPLPGSVTGFTVATSAICSSLLPTTANYTINPVSDAIGYTWSVPSGASIISGDNTTSITVNYSASAVDGNVTVNGVNCAGNGASYSLPVMINKPVGLPISNPIFVPTTSLCVGNNVTYTASDQTNATYYSWIFPTGVNIVSGNGTKSVTVYLAQPVSNGKVYIQGVSGACGAGPVYWVGMQVITVPDAATTISGSNLVSSGQAGVSYSVSTIAYATNYVWTLPSGATITSGTNSNSITVDFSSSFSGGTISVYGNGPCGTGSPSTLDITAAPAIPSASANQSFCTGAKVSDLSATVPFGCDLVWYASSTNGSAIDATTPLTTTTYYAESQNNSTGLASTSRTAVAVTVNITPTITSTTPGSLCVPGSVTLGATASAGTINWFELETGGTSIWTGTSFTTPSLTATKTYYVSSTDNGCTSSPRIAITATINTRPTIISTSPGSRVEAGTVTLSALASSGIINWYSDATGGSSLGSGTSFTTPSLTSTTTYYVDANSNGCYSTSRTAITATINTLPATVTGNMAFCVGTTGSQNTYTANNFTNPRFYEWIVTAAGAYPTSATTTYWQTSDGFIAYTASNTIDIFFPSSTSVTSGNVTISTNEGDASLPLTIFKPAAAASNIAGPMTIYTNVPSDLTERIYSIAPFYNGESYVWQPPTGSTVVSTNQNTITLTFSPSFSGGTITAFGVNGPCGAGTSSSATIVAKTQTLDYMPSLTYLTSDQIPNPDTRDFTSKPVGSTAGSVNVSTSGTASYSIPIITPLGTAGIQPGVAVTYSSNTGVGLLGKGWDLSGVSAISRVGQDIYHDNNVDRVNYDSNDKFALDGSRLICTTGTYGSDNSEYGTEFESFSKILKTGNYFTVETKGGRILEYGKTDDSRMESDQGVIEWYLDKVTDKYGNYIQYTYYRNQVTNECLLSKIDYTGSASLAPYNSIEFYYAIKNDPTWDYYASASKRVVLQKIKVTSETALVREYQFNYANIDGTKLVEVLEKAPDGSIYNSTVFDWQNRNWEYQEKTTNCTDNPLSFFGDFNGDGRTDYVRVDGTNWSLYIANTDGVTFSNRGSGATNNGFLGFMVADFNGDGLDDLLEYHSGAQTGYYYEPLFSTGTGFTRRTDNGFYSKVLANIGDFNGDGIADCLLMDDYAATQNWSIYSCTNTSHDQFSILAQGAGKYLAKNVITRINKVPFDFNGDGRTDMLIINDASYAQYYAFDGTTFNLKYSSNYPNSNNNLFFGDFNGDGLTDVLTQVSGTQWKAVYSMEQGASIKDLTFTNSISASVADLNGDGKTDIITQDNNSDVYGFSMYISRGLTFAAPVAITGGNQYTLNLWGDNFSDFNGDGIPDVFYYDLQTSTKKLISFATGLGSQFVKSITNGMNIKTEFQYKPLTDNTVYTKGTGAAFPVIDYQAPMYVVSVVKSDNGMGGNSEIDYTYSGLKIHRQGKGWLGFTKATSTNVASAIKVESTSDYNRTFYNPYEVTNEAKASDGTQLSLTTYTNDVKDFTNNRIFPYVSKVVSTDALKSITQTSTFVYDDYGNQTSAITDNSGEGTTTVTSTYVNAGALCPSKPDASTVTKVVGTEAPYTRTMNNTYNDNGQVLTSTTDQASTKWATTTYEYNNPFGLPTKATVTGADVTGSRYTAYEYDTKGRFATKVTNNLGQFTEATYDGATGNVKTSKDINGLQTTYGYDAFGRPNLTTMPNGNTVSASLNWKDTNAPANAVYYSLTQTSGSAPIKTYLDRLGRAVRQVNKGFDGADIYSDKTYNTLGQVYQTTDPYFSTSSPEWTTYSYDSYGRSTGVTAPTGNATVAYNGRTVTSTNTSAVPQQVFTKTINAFGQLVSATDAGGTVSYAYNSSGLPKTVTSPGSAVTTMQYDPWGNQTLLIEPNAGTINYTYDAFHELLTQTKNGVASSLTYDGLGRVKTLTETEGTTTYTYDTKTNGQGMLAGITAPGGVSEDYNYDSYGRPSSKTETIDGLNFAESLIYDSYGRLQTLTYPASFAVTYNYNTNGYLNEIIRADNNSSIWKVQTMNARGQIEQFKSGNGLVTNQTFDHGFVTGIQTGTIQNLQYSWDKATGNLTWRKDANRNLTENFGYDNLDRLTGITGSSTATYTFAANGNIATSTPAGAYTYKATQPNALETVTNPQGLISYDNQTVQYTSFDKVKAITDGAKTVTLAYGADKERRKMVLNDGANNLTRYYAHGNYEKETGTNARELFYIASGTGVAAIYEKKAATSQMYYVHKDHLGSVNVITNESGAIVEEMNFDAWGRRRNPTDWSYTGVPATHIIDRGYTGHEHLDGFGVVNMNGRVYDPITGRFLSPDNGVGHPMNTQSYNRFSYCLNNPLKYNDPTGWDDNTSGGAGETSYTYTSPWDAFTYHSTMGLSFDAWNYATSPARNMVAYQEMYAFNSQNNAIMARVYAEVTHQIIIDPFGHEYNTRKTGDGYLTVDINFTGYKDGDNGKFTPSWEALIYENIDIENAQNEGGGEGWYDPASKATYGLGLVAEGMSDFGKSGKLMKIGELTGKGTIGVGIVFDVIGVRNYYKKGPADPNSVSPVKAISNTGVAVAGIWFPELAIIYGGVDLFYPGGMPGYANDTQLNINRVSNSELSTPSQIQQNLGIYNMFGSGGF